VSSPPCQQNAFQNKQAEHERGRVRLGTQDKQQDPEYAEKQGSRCFALEPYGILAILKSQLGDAENDVQAGKQNKRSPDIYGDFVERKQGNGTHKPAFPLSEKGEEKV